MEGIVSVERGQKLNPWCWLLLFCKFWDFHSGEDSSRGLPGCDDVWSCDRDTNVSNYQRWSHQGPLKRWYPYHNTTQRHNEEDLGLKHHHRENLKARTMPVKSVKYNLKVSHRLHVVIVTVTPTSKVRCPPFHAMLVLLMVGN